MTGDKPLIIAYLIIGLIATITFVLIVRGDKYKKEHDKR